MSLLDRLFHRTATAPPVATEAVCVHTVLVPHWTAVADMGHEERATSFTCQACTQTFTAAEGLSLRASQAARVQEHLNLDH